MTLVALFSAPACPMGSTMQVIFHQSGKQWNDTDWKACSGNTSVNFYVAGMYPSTTYNMNYQVQTGGKTTPGPRALSFTTGALPSPRGEIPMNRVSRKMLCVTEDCLIHLKNNTTFQRDLSSRAMVRAGRSKFLVRKMSQRRCSRS